MKTPKPSFLFGFLAFFFFSFFILSTSPSAIHSEEAAESHHHHHHHHHEAASASASHHEDDHHLLRADEGEKGVEEEKGEMNYKEGAGEVNHPPVETVDDAPDTVDERCPSVSPVAKRRQGIFKHLIRRWRKSIESQQPWDSWSRKIIKCSLGRQLYAALGPESKIHMTENIKAVLMRELKLKQTEMAGDERKKNPCHPFLMERGKLKAILKFRASMVLARKPIIYLYPEAPTQVNVTVKLNSGEFTSVYPKFGFDQKWIVEAHPCGTLKDLTTSKKYNYLFWEAKRSPFQLDTKNGKCIKKEDTERYLEMTLSKLGLNDKERNDFIVYWLPELEKNPFNLISFSTEEYNEWSKLHIEPQPQTLIRIFMTYSPLKEEIPSSSSSILPLEPPKRSGFTVVEWGGAAVPSTRK